MIVDRIMLLELATANYIDDLGHPMSAGLIASSIMAVALEDIGLTLHATVKMTEEERYRLGQWYIDQATELKTPDEETDV